MMKKLAVLVLLGCAAAMAAVPRPEVQVVTTDHVDVVPGGSIHIENSSGDLTVEGWDEPRVEITVTRVTFAARDTTESRDAATRDLNLVHITQSKTGENGITISTASPKRWSHVSLSYRIMVPKSSSIVIRHTTGDVRIGGVEGEIDATMKAGDLVLQLPGSGKYGFDATCGEGTIVSDFSGTYSRVRGIGEKYSESGASGAKRHHLHVGMGAITIQGMPTT
jgi:hypothetical protein